MKKAALVLAVSSLTCWSEAKELVVDASQKTEGAFPTIQKAVDAAAAGDVVTVKAGTYGGFNVAKAYAGEPLTVCAAKGERVIVSGFAKITDWKDEGNGVYSAKTKAAVKHLFVGMHPQQCARCHEPSVREERQARAYGRGTHGDVRRFSQGAQRQPQEQPRLLHRLSPRLTP